MIIQDFTPPTVYASEFKRLQKIAELFILARKCGLTPLQVSRKIYTDRIECVEGRAYLGETGNGDYCFVLYGLRIGDTLNNVYYYQSGRTRVIPLDTEWKDGDWTPEELEARAEQDLEAYC